MTTKNLTASELRGAIGGSLPTAEAARASVRIADLTATPFAGQRGIRDSKNPGGPALLIAKGSFAIFMTAVKAGEFDS